ncbi:MAG: nucleotidyl transferase AbiEii/AbiGii toxin family protein [Candidatus Dormibacteraceae bacterium]
MILKGGTCLRLAHFANYRFSADLDYSAADLTLHAASELIRRGAKADPRTCGLSLLRPDRRS